MPTKPQQTRAVHIINLTVSLESAQTICKSQVVVSYSQHLFVHGLNLLHQSRWWRRHMAGIYSDCSTREIIILYLCMLYAFEAQFHSTCIQSKSGLLTFSCNATAYCYKYRYWHQRASVDGVVPTTDQKNEVQQKISVTLPSVLWCCWLGSRKGIWPVKNWVLGCWRDYLSGARCRLAYGPADATATHWLLLQ